MNFNTRPDQTFAQRLTEPSEMIKNAWGESVFKASASSPFVEIMNSLQKMSSGSSQATAFNKAVERAWDKDPEVCVKLMFATYDVRGGTGSGLREQFRIFLDFLDFTSPSTLTKNLEHIPFYGRWDMLIEVFLMTRHQNTRMKVLGILAEVFTEDLQSDAPTLLGKWMPREKYGTSLYRQERMRFLRGFVSFHYGGCSDYDFMRYRKDLKKLMGKISIVEAQMSSNNWNKIDYSKVPSVAGYKYRRAFGRNDADRYSAFMAKAESGEVTVNAGVLDFVKMHDMATTRGTESQANASWLNRRVTDKVNALALIDLSGSMYGDGANALAVSVGLHIAENNSGPFKDTIGVFATKPVFINVDGNSKFSDRVRKVYDVNAGLTTELGLTFDYILSTARQNNLAQEEMPEMLFIISDMEVSDGYGSGWSSFRMELSFLDKTKQRFADAGYEMPHIVWWSARNNDKMIVREYHDKCTVMSGSGPSAVNYICHGDSPLDIVKNIVSDDRYDRLSI